MLRTLWRTAPLSLALVLPDALLGARALPDPLVEGPAPDSFPVSFETRRAPFVVKAHRDWSPRGVDRVCPDLDAIRSARLVETARADRHTFTMEAA